MDPRFLIEFKNHVLTIFNPETMDFYKWLNSIEYATKVLKLTELEKSTLLLDYVESSVLTEIMNYFCPKDPFFCPYEELTYRLETFYGKLFNREDAPYYRFLVRDQLPYEPAQHYINVLTELLSKRCPTINVWDNLKCRFIEGLEDDDTRALLQNHPGDMTLAIAVNIAKIKESSKNKYKISSLENS